ncbi:MAG: tetratricopeptide repeat protein, partial [Chloroflexota bacterium]
GRIQTLQGWLARRRGDFAQAETMLQKSVAILQELEDRGLLAQAWLQWGYLHQAQGNWDRAETAFRQASELRLALGERHLAIEPQAGLTAVYHHTGNLAKAAETAEPVINFLVEKSANGTDETLQIYLSCYQVLVAVKDGRLSQIQQRAKDLLQQRASTIQDASDQATYLQAIPAHAEIQT